MKIEDIKYKPLGIYGMGIEGKSLFSWLLKKGANKVFCFDENFSGNAEFEKLTKEQKEIFEVTFGERKETVLKDKEGNKIFYIKGNRRYGANHIKKHFGAKAVGAIECKEILLISEILKKGDINNERTLKEKHKNSYSYVYEYIYNDILLSLVVGTQNGNDKNIIISFYSQCNFCFYNKKTGEGLPNGQPDSCLDTSILQKKVIIVNSTQKKEERRENFSFHFLPVSCLPLMKKIFRSPGVHPQKILKYGVQKEKISSSTQLFFDLCPTKNIIGVTGTKGKGTTSSLIYEMLEEEFLIDKNIKYIESLAKKTQRDSWELQEQKNILEVTFGIKKKVFIQNYKKEKVEYPFGNRRYGAHKIWNRHYGKNSVGTLSPYEISQIGIILREGKINPKREGKNKYGSTQVYEKQIGDFLFSVIITLLNNGKKMVMNAYSNRNMNFISQKKEGVDTSSQQSPSSDISIVSKDLKKTQDNFYCLPRVLQFFPYIFLGGNIGTPVFDFFDEISEKDIVVLEISSFQLYDLKKSPKISVLLRTDSEHLDWHSDICDYRNAKKNIFLHQKKGDVLVYFGESEIVKDMVLNLSLSDHNGTPLQHKKIPYTSRFSEREKEKFSSVGLRGNFHQENILAAIAVAKKIGVSETVQKKIVSQFSGLPMRCELVAEKNGRKFFNDSFSTIPETTISALSTFSSPVYLILGGSEKNSDFTCLATEISTNKNIQKIYLIGDTAQRISDSLTQFKIQNSKFKILGSLDEIFQDFSQVSRKGDSLLLSPGCASFGMFQNYKHRGEVFNTLVENFPPHLPESNTSNNHNN